MSTDPVAEANALLAEKGYKEPHLAVHVTAMPGRVLLKGSKIVSPFSDSPDTVLRSSGTWFPRWTSSARGS